MIAIAGAWRLARVEMRRRDGRAGPPIFPGVMGRLEYRVDGTMSFELAEGTWRRAWRGGYSAYLDPFAPSNDAVVHRIETASDPELIGLGEARRVQLRGDTLTWPGAPVWVEGERWTPQLVWERLES